MKIGILGAMEEEIRLLTEQIEKSTVETRAMRQYISGKIAGHKVCLVFSRWGKVAAAATAATLIERYGVDFLLFTGVAGGVDPALNIGDIVVADTLIQHDMDVSLLPDLEEFEIPLLGRADFPVEKEYVQKAVQAAENWLAMNLHKEVDFQALAQFSITAPKVVRGTIASGDQFIANSSKIAELRKKITDLRCVEMEGASVAQVAYEYGIPCLVLRTISDKANSDAVIDFPHFITSVAPFFTCGSVRFLLEMWK